MLSMSFSTPWPERVESAVCRCVCFTEGMDRSRKLEFVRYRANRTPRFFVGFCGKTCF